MGCLPAQHSSKPANVAPTPERRDTIQEHNILFWDPRNIGASCGKRNSESTSPERIGPEPESIDLNADPISFKQGDGKPEKGWIKAAEMSSAAQASVEFADTQEFEEKVSSVQPNAVNTSQLNHIPQASGLSGISTIVDHIFPLSQSKTHIDL